MNATFAEVPNAETIGQESQAGHSARTGPQATAKAVFCMPSLVLAGKKLPRTFPEIFQRFSKKNLTCNPLNSNLDQPPRLLPQEAPGMTRSRDVDLFFSWGSQLLVCTCIENLLLTAPC